MAFQLVKYGMSGGCNLFELLYGRKFSADELASQPLKDILMECLIYDNDLEQEYIKRQETKRKESEGKLVIGGRDVNQILFDMKYSHLDNAIVTLLTTEEYLKIAKSKNND